MRILLIQPAKQSISMGGEEVFLYEPLALEYIAAGVSEDHDVMIFDQRLENKLPDVLLIPYSCPATPGFFPRRYRQNWIDTYHDAPAIFAKHLRTPIISCNKTGDFLSPMPMGFGMQYSARFIDRTSIVDNNGTVLSEIDGIPGVAVAIVETRSAGDAVGIKIPSGRWFLPISQFTRFMSEMTQKFGKIRYATSRKRRMAASQVVGHD